MRIRTSFDLCSHGQIVAGQGWGRATVRHRVRGDACKRQLLTWLIRTLWLLLFLGAGIGELIYLGMWLVVPRCRRSRSTKAILLVWTCYMTELAIFFLPEQDNSGDQMTRNFESDVADIANGLIDVFGLTFLGAEAHLNDPVARWLDYRLRYIDPMPRTVNKSHDFDSRVPASALAALHGFIQLVENGADLNPYQTKKIQSNDTSGKKRQLRTDGLWADWGIHHVHLTEVPISSGKEFSERSDWLLFFLVAGTELMFIDVRDHDQAGLFQDVSLIEMAIESWPDHFEHFALKGVVGLARPPETDAVSVGALRKGGVTQFLEIGGKIYMPPGMGVTTAATSTKVSLKRDEIIRNARGIEKFFYDPNSFVVKETEKLGVTNPSFALGISPSGELIISCIETRATFPFPAPPNPSDARSQLESLLLPPWAATKLVAKRPR